MTPQQKYGKKIFNKLYDSTESAAVEEQRLRLRKALIPRSPVEFISEGLFYGAIAGVTLWLMSMLLIALLFFVNIIPEQFGIVQTSNQYILTFIDLVKIPSIIIITGIIFGTLGFIVTYYSYLLYPQYVVASGRGREISALLSDSVSYMYALSVSGMNELEIFRAIAEAEDTYGEIAIEFQVLLKETNYFDTDYRSAIQKRSEETPNTELSIFFSDMLSILSSGGDIEAFLSEQRRKFLRDARQEQEDTLETLELFGEMFMTLSLFPLLLIIVIVAMSISGEADPTLLYGAAYGLIPAIGVGFLVLIATFKQDELGKGEINDPNVTLQDPHPLSTGELADSITGSMKEGQEFAFFKTAKKKEYIRTAKEILKQPHIFFREYPFYTLIVTVPLSIFTLIAFILTGLAPLSMDALQEQPVWGTMALVFIPFYIVAIPLSFFYEWHEWNKGKVTKRLSATLRKISNANDTGMTLIEAMEEVGKSSNDKLSNELLLIHKKTQLDYSLKEGLIEFNNKYGIPRLARVIKIIIKSQETSNDITAVLSTVAELSEKQDDLDRNRKSSARMQVAIILMTYVTLLGVMVILQTQFIDVMTSLTEGTETDSGGEPEGSDQFSIDVDPQELSMIFFHAISAQAIFSGLTSGYIRSANLVAGLKYCIILVGISIITWGVLT